jgi:membrane-associated PAP2 superfamily phosphatase
MAAAMAAALLLVLAWDASGLDLALAQGSGSSRGFPLHGHWLLATVLHDAGRRLAWLLVVAASLAVWWPVGPWRRIAPRGRLQFAATALACALAIALFKGASATSCPWDLRDFGGLAPHRSHWDPTADGGPGHCFPAGHAVAGFGFAGGWFAWREADPAVARRWGWGSVAAGLLFGAAQQMRGAHFFSHTLWTAWICWCIAWVADVLRRRCTAQEKAA